MRKRRYQKPRIKNVGGYWIGQYRDLHGTKRKVSLGPVKQVKKYDAEQEFAHILEPVNAKTRDRNPAELLFVPSEAPRPVKTFMTFDQVRVFFAVLELREKVIGGLAILAGMRPGEIFALTRARLEKDYADIQQRVYRGEIGTPKTYRSKRWAALGDGLSSWIRQWLDLHPDGSPDAWLFPSERITTTLSKDNCWRRGFLPRLKDVNLGWVNFQVMRRTHSCLMDELQIDPQVRAEQMGHSVDVNQNEYTTASLERRLHAVNKLEKAVGVM